MNRLIEPNAWMKEIIQIRKDVLARLYAKLVVGGADPHLFGMFVGRECPAVTDEYDPRTAPPGVCDFNDGVFIMPIALRHKSRLPLINEIQKVEPRDFGSDVKIMLVDGEDYFVGYTQRDFDYGFVSVLSVRETLMHPASYVISSLLKEEIPYLRATVLADAVKLGVHPEELVLVIYLRGKADTEEVLSMHEYEQIREREGNVVLDVRTRMRKDMVENLPSDFKVLADELREPANPDEMFLVINGLGVMLRQTVTLYPQTAGAPSA